MELRRSASNAERPDEASLTLLLLTSCVQYQLRAWEWGALALKAVSSRHVEARQNLAWEWLPEGREAAEHSAGMDFSAQSRAGHWAGREGLSPQQEKKTSRARLSGATFVMGSLGSLWTKKEQVRVLGQWNWCWLSEGLPQTGVQEARFI